jgi:hypothetical protein
VGGKGNSGRLDGKTLEGIYDYLVYGVVFLQYLSICCNHLDNVLSCDGRCAAKLYARPD